MSVSDNPVSAGVGAMGAGDGPVSGSGDSRRAGGGLVSGGSDPESAVGGLVGGRGDRFVLRGLRARGYHGVFEHERRDGLEFVIDAVLWTDTAGAARTDDLAGTADYGALAGRLVAIVTGEPVNLIETLASRLAEACLADPAVREAEVTVHKPQAPIPFPFEDVAVTIRRARA
jgi:dihydroneopterin aldolase